MGFQATSIVDNKLAIGPRKVCENINSFVRFYSLWFYWSIAPYPFIAHHVYGDNN